MLDYILKICKSIDKKQFILYFKTLLNSKGIDNFFLNFVFYIANSDFISNKKPITVLHMTSVWKQIALRNENTLTEVSLC